jgi:CheY-like chemotaxis protein
MDKLIYIIDDDPIVLRLTSKLIELHSSDFRSEQFPNGLEALNHIRNVIETGCRLPDVIFLDLNMPVLDGWQFLEAYNLLPIEEPVPIYIVTSSIDSADIERARTFLPPLNGYIMKPFTEEKLSEIPELSISVYS